MLLQQKQGGRAVSGIRVASFMRLYFSIRERALSQINFLMVEIEAIPIQQLAI